MRFSILAATISAVFLGFSGALPTEGGVVTAGDAFENSTAVALESRATCDTAYTLKFYKSQWCNGQATRTDIQNYPADAAQVNRCVNVNSLADLKGMYFQANQKGEQVPLGPWSLPLRLLQGRLPGAQEWIPETHLPWGQKGVGVGSGHCNQFAVRSKTIKSYWIKTWEECAR
ncbi:hypothetical protein PG993_008703 [Apiospora rasikravindrae]|uniref:Secreted protein n=1 Tax=Apiospora rasikravindrae TaxID=990691 RepID=A0ABR1SP33_9PEZI